MVKTAILFLASMVVGCGGNVFVDGGSTSSGSQDITCESVCQKERDACPNKIGSCATACGHNRTAQREHGVQRRGVELLGVHSTAILPSTARAPTVTTRRARPRRMRSRTAPDISDPSAKRTPMLATLGYGAIVAVGFASWVSLKHLLRLHVRVLRRAVRSRRSRDPRARTGAATSSTASVLLGAFVGLGIGTLAQGLLIAAVASAVMRRAPAG